MGCWDVFCFICGNPCHSMLNGYIDDVTKDFNLEKIPSKYSKYTKDKIKKLQSYPNLIIDLKQLKTNWMNKCTMLLINDKIVHGVQESSCNVSFTKPNFSATHMGAQIMEYDCYNGDCGVFIHTDCWKFIKKNYKIELKFSNLPKLIYLKSNQMRKLTPTEWNKTFDIDYGDIEKYWEQDFDFAALVADKKKYLCSSPLKEDKNIKQIKKNISALKLKNEPERVGPSVSATFYDEGDIKLGKNKYFWIKKNNKWLLINEKPIKIITKPTDKLIKIPYIGQSNVKPVFIISNEKNKLELLLTESYKNILVQNKHLIMK
uniref:Uncharacterized protein n=1 Tax=viral metagenome TaxID=1070528 RepID=A0A6C0DA87_9ZZZZ